VGAAAAEAAAVAPLPEWGAPLPLGPPKRAIAAAPEGWSTPDPALPACAPADARPAPLTSGAAPPGSSSWWRSCRRAGCCSAWASRRCCAARRATSTRRCGRLAGAPACLPACLAAAAAAAAAAACTRQSLAPRAQRPPSSRGPTARRLPRRACVPPPPTPWFWRISWAPSSSRTSTAPPCSTSTPAATTPTA
jgi:hypothetical protein